MVSGGAAGAGGAAQEDIEKVVYKVARLDACRVLVDAYEELETAFEEFIPAAFHDACRPARAEAPSLGGALLLPLLPHKHFAAAMRAFKPSWQADDLTRLWSLGTAGTGCAADEASQGGGGAGSKALTLQGFDKITDFTTCVRVHFRRSYLAA